MDNPEDDDPSLSEAELLDMPEQNLPAGSFHRLRNRRESARLKKEITLFEQTLQTQTQQAKLDKQAADDNAYFVMAEQFENTMKDIRYREDLLLIQIDREEKLIRKRLEDIERRAIKLHDGRRAYVGSNRGYIDEHGTVLQGADEDDARHKHATNPNAATWQEKVAITE